MGVCACAVILFFILVIFITIEADGMAPTPALSSASLMSLLEIGSRRTSGGEGALLVMSPRAVEQPSLPPAPELSFRDDFKHSRGQGIQPCSGRRSGGAVPIVQHWRSKNKSDPVAVRTLN